MIGMFRIKVSMIDAPCTEASRTRVLSGLQLRLKYTFIFKLDISHPLISQDCFQLKEKYNQRKELFDILSRFSTQLHTSLCNIKITIIIKPFLNHQLDLLEC